MLRAARVKKQRHQLSSDYLDQKYRNLPDRRAKAMKKRSKKAARDRKQKRTNCQDTEFGDLEDEDEDGDEDEDENE